MIRFQTEFDKEILLLKKRLRESKKAIPKQDYKDQALKIEVCDALVGQLKANLCEIERYITQLRFNH